MIALWSCLGALSVLPAAAQTETSELREIRELRALVEQQLKQIETLSAQVAKLTAALDTQKPAAPSPAPAPAPAAPETAPAPPPAPTPTAEAPRAEAVSDETKHVVEKGETLTSIAKHYNISVADLQKQNKITDGRKLQIGQTLTIPTPKTEPHSDKKENP